MSKPVIATASLAGCFGCHMSFLDMDERIFDLIELIQLEKTPLNDIKDFTRACDIGLIEGGCCTSEHIHTLREFRSCCGVLVAVGECAIMGGLPAMRNNIPIQECLEEAYLNSPSTTVANPEKVLPNDDELPMLLDKVYPCHEIVRMDYFLPGCPPRADLICATLNALLSGQEAELPYEIVKFD
ncbi:MAG: NADP oxidoreductase [Candidatus Electrothrix sp. AR4]|nr:NADP oxidoreductase [Candidatus Electrothrix sp. AR4]